MVGFGGGVVVDGFVVEGCCRCMVVWLWRVFV